MTPNKEWESRLEHQAWERMVGHVPAGWHSDNLTACAMRWLVNLAGKVIIECGDERNAFAVKTPEGDKTLCNFGETLQEALVAAVLTVDMPAVSHEVPA